MTEAGSIAEATAADGDLVVFLETLADNKRRLGERYAEWCTAAPSLESAVAAAAMAQDEIGHARSFYPLLQDIAGASHQTEPETRTELRNAPFLDREFQSWTDFVAANFLFDTALTVLLEAAVDSTLTGLAQRAKRILSEEPLHWLHAEGWIRRLAVLGAEVSGALQSSLRAIQPEALDLFDVVVPQLTRDRVVGKTAAELRDLFRARVDAVLATAGLDPS